MTVTNTFSGTYFSATLPDIKISTSAVRVHTKMDIDGVCIYDEYLYPIIGEIRIRDLTTLFTPYAKARLSIAVNFTFIEQNLVDGLSTEGTPVTLSGTVIYCAADMNISAQEFIDGHFLSLLIGTKITAIGRLEYLHYIGTDVASVTSYYSDGSIAQFTPDKVGGNSKYTTIDVSAAHFSKEGLVLCKYVVTAGSRTQNFEIDFDIPDCAPILLFVNSFGCQELAYCTGTHQVAPEYKRSTTYIDGKLRNYDIQETRTFKANTGILNFEMSNWFDDVFRSQEIYIVNIYNDAAAVGREMVIVDSKSDNSNNDDELPRFTFSYQYAQINQNVLQLERAGRIFDNTFDNTFN